MAIIEYIFELILPFRQAAYQVVNSEPCHCLHSLIILLNNHIIVIPFTSNHKIISESSRNTCRRYAKLTFLSPTTLGGLMHNACICVLPSVTEVCYLLNFNQTAERILSGYLKNVSTVLTVSEV